DQARTFRQSFGELGERGGSSDLDMVVAQLLGDLPSEDGLATAPIREKQQRLGRLHHLACGEVNWRLRCGGLAQGPQPLGGLVFVREVDPQREARLVNHRKSFATSGLWTRWISIA